MAADSAILPPLGDSVAHRLIHDWHQVLRELTSARASRLPHFGRGRIGDGLGFAVTVPGVVANSTN